MGGEGPPKWSGKKRRNEKPRAVGERSGILEQGKGRKGKPSCGIMMLEKKCKLALPIHIYKAAGLGPP